MPLATDAINPTLLVDRRDFSKIQMAEFPMGTLADGHIRLRLGRFALTANNISYMVAGDNFDYWRFFDPSAYDQNYPGMGRMPVWGYGEIIQSRCEALPAGQMVYGFFPIAHYLDLLPGHIHSDSFQDIAAHRQSLHPVYNTYTLIDHNPAFDLRQRALQPVLRPLFTTSFLIDDQFGAEQFYHAQQIILLSASSKTALGTAFCLKARHKVQVIGMTSARNAAFVTSTGYYDQVVTYDDLAALDHNPPTALIDMAGNGAVTRAVYERLGTNIVYNCMVGKSHWGGDAPPKMTAGALPVMFFAPDRARKRIHDWGMAGFSARLSASWQPFIDSVQSWMQIKQSSGVKALTDAYRALLGGQVPADLAYLLRLAAD